MGREFLERPVFTVGGVRCCWRDVLAAMPPDPPLAAGAEESEADFRYARNLISADETQAWLERWNLSPREWHEWLRGVRGKDRLVDAVCSGTLEHRARGLALEAAACAWAGEEVRLPPGRACLEPFRARFATADAIERELGLHALDWVEVVSELLTVDGGEAAREAALCIREDGLSPAEVATRSGGRLSEERIVLADAEPQLQSQLLGAEPGQLVGPTRDGDAHVLRVVRARREPDVSDPGLRARAATAVLARAYQRELGPLVEWHESV